MSAETVNNASLKSKTFKGTIWGTLERFGAQGISFVVVIIMARILTPADYGLVGMVLVFVNIAQALMESGFGQALIQKQDRTEADNSTAFYFNVALGVVFFGVIWFLAPAFAKFYEQPQLIWITRVIALPVLFNSLSVVQKALLTVEIDFKTQAKASMFAAIVAGGVGILMAYTGWGVWSIVAYNVVNLGCNSALLWVFSSWRPSWLFSWVSFRQLFSFGAKVAASGFIHTFYVNGFNMVIGKVYKAADLGFYTRAQQFVSFFSTNISGIILRVSYPVLCKFQNDDDQLRNAFIKMIRASSLVVFACMLGMAGVAKPMIGLLLGERWMFSATLMQILCFGYMWFPLYSMNLNILLVKARTGLYLKLEIIKKLIFILVLAVTIPLGIKAMCWAIVANAFVEIFVNSYYTQRLIGISIFRMLLEILPSLIYSLSMAAVTWLVATFVPGSHLIKFVVSVISGLIFFFSITFLTRSKDLAYILSFIKKKR